MIMLLKVVPGVGGHVVKSCSRCGCSKHWLQSLEQSTTTTLFSLSLTLRNGIVSTKTLKSKLNEGIFLRRGHIWHGWHVCCIGYALWNWFISAIWQFKYLTCFDIFLCWWCNQMSCKFFDPNHSFSLLHCISANRFPLSGKSEHCQRHNGPEGWVLVTKVTSLGHITSSQTNLN